MKNLHLCLLLTAVTPPVQAESGFVHPGLLHSREDLNRIQQAVAARQEPIYSGYEVFRTHPQSQSNYGMQGPGNEVGRNPNINSVEYDSDANAAYQNALQWVITGDIVYAEKAKEILNGWSYTLETVSGRDAVLMAGLGPFKMVNAAEIIRHTDAGWSGSDVQQAERCFREVIYPVLMNFAPFANGNWDAAATRTMLGIGVFCDDRAMVERALRYYVGGHGNGCLTHYVINEEGQCQESGRDVQHTQLGLALLADCCEIAWNQGLDLYGHADTRLLKGFEYTADYAMGGDVPFTEWLDRTGKYHHHSVSDKGRDRLRAVFEQVYNHYMNRRGIPAPYTQQAAEAVRPEGPGLPGADHPGFGTLLFSRLRGQADTLRSNKVPAAPVGLTAMGSPAAVRLTWVASVGATGYTVKRATSSGGPYGIIAAEVRSPEFADTDVQAGEVYHYTISASNEVGESPDAYQTRISAGLPEPWAVADVGKVEVAGCTSFDGRGFTLEGAGNDIGSTNDQFQFASVPMNGDGAVAARFVPQVNSQFSEFGCMMRASSAADSPHVSLLITPEATSDIEQPGWKVLLAVRESSGAAMSVVGSRQLGSPTVLHGRLVGNVWLRLKRHEDRFTGVMSTDGETWSEVGAISTSLDETLLSGLAGCSHLDTVTTTVKFDHVSAPGWNTEPAATRVTSPDRKVVVDFALLGGGVPSYQINYLDRPIVLRSQMGLLPSLTNGFEMTGIASSIHEGHWTNRFGERRVVPENYHELSVDLRHESGTLLRLVFRAYNEGAAFRYSFPARQGGEIRIEGEQSEFRFPADTFGYEEHGTEGEYHRVLVSEIEPFCERPLTLEFADGSYASLTEAANVNYPRMLLSPLNNTPVALVSALGGETSNTARHDQRHDPTATLAAGDSTPWRVFVLGKSPGDLLERNYLILNLNPATRIADTSWIRPGKVIRETTLTTTGALACVDFAVRQGLQYIHFDTGWYGPEGTDADATGVDPSRDLDLQQVIDYGASRGVGVILYVNRLALKHQIDLLPELYQKWGVKGIKFGFVNVGPQVETAWITESISKAAEHQLILNIHDGYRPTGNNRTWPNLLTVEGIRGNEHMPTPEHNCTLPFTRYVAGIGDYTVCYYKDRIQTTRAHQLAMAVVSFSPLQYLFWYDKPSDHQGEPEIEFFREVPTVWDETRVVHGEIGQYASIARRSGEEWFVGSVNNSEPREMKLPLDFLSPDKPYTARIYGDSESVETRTQVGIVQRTVDASTVINMHLFSGGGQAVWLFPSER